MKSSLALKRFNFIFSFWEAFSKSLIVTNYSFTVVRKEFALIISACISFKSSFSPTWIDYFSISWWREETTVSSSNFFLFTVASSSYKSFLLFPSFSFAFLFLISCEWAVYLEWAALQLCTSSFLTANSDTWTF